MLFCGVHPYRNQSNKISPVSFFFKNALYVLLALLKRQLLVCYLVTRPHVLIQKEDQVSLLVF